MAPSTSTSVTLRSTFDKKVKKTSSCHDTLYNELNIIGQAAPAFPILSSCFLRWLVSECFLPFSRPLPWKPKQMCVSKFVSLKILGICILLGECLQKGSQFPLTKGIGSKQREMCLFSLCRLYLGWLWALQSQLLLKAHFHLLKETHHYRGVLSLWEPLALGARGPLKYGWPALRCAGIKQTLDFQDLLWKKNVKCLTNNFSLVTCWLVILLDILNRMCHWK